MTDYSSYRDALEADQQIVKLAETMLSLLRLSEVVEEEDLFGVLLAAEPDLERIQAATDLLIMRGQLVPLYRRVV